jgi:glycosyltransferase involved in cell wall biosynthesis
VTPRKPRLLIVGRTRYDLPLDESLTRKFSALDDRCVVRVLASAGDVQAQDDRFDLVRRARPAALDGVAFHSVLPFRIARELRSFAPDVVLVQGAHEGAAALAARTLARSKTPVVLDIHGDWRAATRLYGSAARRVLGRAADRVAVAAVRRADAVRTVSRFTSQLVGEVRAEPVFEFPAFMDVHMFLERPAVPLPEQPVVLFVGVLERYKGIDGLAAAWRRVAARLPKAQLRIVGDGSRARVVRKLLADLPGQTTWVRALSRRQIEAELDAATCLVLPSPCEGMGRVIVEAFCRGRPVIGARAGGIPELVVDGENGILVPPRDADALRDALVHVLTSAEAVRMGAAARVAAERFAISPDAYAAALAGVVASVVERGREVGGVPQSAPGLSV